MSDAASNSERSVDTGEIVEDPVFGMRSQFSRDGNILRIELSVDPGGGPLLHIHPIGEERYEVLEGDVTFIVGKQKVPSGPGDRHVIVPGQRHTFRNSGTGVARMILEHEPPLAFQELLEELAAFSQAGKITRQGIPKGIGPLLEFADLAQRYRDEVIRADALLPPGIQPLIVPPLARLHRWRQGRRAG